MTTRLPPARYFVGCLLIGMEIVLLENASHITSGGGGLSIATAAWIHWPVGLLNILIKALLLGVVWSMTGHRTAIWTAISIVLVGGAAWVSQLLPLSIYWSAFG